MESLFSTTTKRKCDCRFEPKKWVVVQNC